MSHDVEWRGDAGGQQSPDRPSSASRLLDYRSKYRVKPKTPDTPTPAGSLLSPPSSLATLSPPMPTLPPFQPPVVVAAPEVWLCRLCGHRANTEPAFQTHLTTAHFRERIIRRIRPPYRCLLCGYLPPATSPESEKVEDLLLHYGIAEKISVKFYEDACKELGDEEEEEEVEESTTTTTTTKAKTQSYDCTLCDLSLDGQRNLLKHLTLRHFPKQLCDDLPKKFPFRCPFIDCNQTRQNLHGLMLHYGVDHIVSMELYRRDGRYKGTAGVAGKGSRSASPAEGGASGTLPPLRGVELPKAAPPRPTKLQAVVSPYHPEMEEKTPPPQPRNTEPRSSSPAAGPSEPRPGGSGVGTPAARARLLKHWRSDSLEGYRKTIEELEAKIREMEAAHKEKLKEKEKDFERWLTAKEAKLEAEMCKNKSLEESLEEKELCIADLNAQLELVHFNFSRVEDDLEAKKLVCEDLMAYKEEALKELQSKEEERLNSYEELYQKEKELERIEETLKERNDFASQLGQQLEEKSTKLSALQTTMHSLCDEVLHLGTELGLRTQPVKEDTTTTTARGIKMVITRDGKRSRSCKNFKAISSPANAGEEITESQGAAGGSDIKCLEEILVQVRSTVKQVADAFQAKNSELTDLEQRVRESEFKAKDLEAKTDVLKGLEKEKKELAKKVKGLETTLADWESRQFTNVKLIAGLEKERDSLQAKLKEMQDGNLSHEDQLYWKDVAIKNKEKEVKALKVVVEEKESKLATLQKEVDEKTSRLESLVEQKADLQKKVAELESEREKRAVEAADMARQMANEANEIKHLKISLSQKTKELSSINTTAVCQKAELDRLMKENEKLEGDYSRAITQLEVAKNSKRELLKKLQQKELSLQALRTKLTAVAAREKAREEEDRMEMELRNQVLTDMDRVIQIQQTRSAHPGISIKEEPPPDDLRHSPDDCIASLNITAADQIVLNVANAAEVIEMIKSEPVDDEEIVDGEGASPRPASEAPTLIVPWPAFVPLASHPELAVQRRKRKLPKVGTLAKTLPVVAAAATGSSGSEKRSRGRLEDVTSLYSEEDGDEENQVFCGICDSWDPPVEEGKAAAAKNTTEWVGCDCGRWFHKTCTKLKRVTNKFSCKSVKLECMPLTEISC